ncbi:MAG TPA: hypothetical protein VMW27_06955, partial [Thermoanaerobaculia bacterium]|nr:hypothetical protein [Thermoanaerobaculia bacterium]
LLERLAAAAGKAVQRQAERSLDRLLERSGPRPVEDLHVLLPFGGGKDSAYTLAYVRLMQLLAKARNGRTFQLHVLTMLHPGVPAGVFENIENVFRALAVESAGEVRIFATALHGIAIPLAPGSIRQDHLEVFRQEVLISGHLSQGNGRETFCNSCNFLLMNAIARYVTDRQGEIDFVITGDSAGEALSYWRWVQKASHRFGLERIPRQRAGWASLFGKLAELNDTYYLQLLGPEALATESPYTFPNVDRAGFRPPEYFGVFAETAYEYWSHAAFLKDFLGFELRQDAFNFTESDCRNPMLMAHLRGLLAEFEGRGYLLGVREYLQFATELMEQKSYDRAMIELALEPYRDAADVLSRRRLAEAYAWDHYRLTAFQLAGLVASPVTDEAARLGSFLRWQNQSEPGLEESLIGYLDALRDELGAEPGLPSSVVEARVATRLRKHRIDLERATAFFYDRLGLHPRSLHLLALRRAVSQPGRASSELELVRIGDPHQRTLAGACGANRVLTGR